MSILFIISIALAGCASSKIPKSARNLDGEALPFSRVHFPTGSDKILKEDEPALLKIADWMTANPQAVIVLEGHADERGADKFNMELGDRRARFVKALLIKLGVGNDRMIMIVSYGELMPIDPAHTPEAWNKNRRVEFILR